MITEKEYKDLKKENSETSEKFYKLEIEYREQEAAIFIKDRLNKFKWIWDVDSLLIEGHPDDPYLDTLWPHSYVKVLYNKPF